jgi:hypothetical protein
MLLMGAMKMQSKKLLSLLMPKTDRVNIF